MYLTYVVSLNDRIIATLNLPFCPRRHDEITLWPEEDDGEPKIYTVKDICLHAKRNREQDHRPSGPLTTAGHYRFYEATLIVGA